MPDWGEILKEYQASAQLNAPLGKGPDGDGIRLKYLKQLSALTGRAVISYSSAWLMAGVNESALTVEGTDVLAMMECCHGVAEDELDLLLHSPGGSPTAAEQVMEYLRTRFKHIRAIVPMQAKSAATMMALGCDEIMMGAHSELGPIDPQIFIATPEGQRFAPAHAILRDFERAMEECKDVTKLPAWTPILRSYSGGLLDFCSQQIDLSMDIVANWLKRYMLADPSLGLTQAQRGTAARRIAKYLGSAASYARFKTHGRPVRRDELKTIGVRITDLEQDHALQDAILSVYHATEISLRGPIVKIVENQNGKRYVRMVQMVTLQGQVLGPQQPAPQPAAPAPQPAQPAPQPATPKPTTP
jgi:hypothetical protein